MAIAGPSRMSTNQSESAIGDALRALDPASVLLVDDNGPTTAAQAVRFTERLGAVLADAGVPPSPRVCVVLPNGTLLALSALGLMAVAAFAPLNPRLTQDEFAASFTDLDADVLVSLAGFAPAAHAAARQSGLCIIDADSDGSWELTSTGDRTRSHRRTGAAADHGSGHALLLHTSGTTARPKLIGLSAENLVASARSVARTIEIGPGDRCLNVMPLFHIHGLVGVLLASVVSGASVRTTERFDPFAFASQLRAPDITWTSAVPSAYNTLLRRANPTASPPGLRFARSSSAPLPAVVAERLERVLSCPVINAYGMTEASHQMTSNPVPPGERRAGTVGRPAGADVAVLAADTVATTPGVLGEVVVRGPGLMAGYLAPAEANASAWHDGWFRTGDLGSLDDAGYLTLHGRIKEIINVAGEKVSPYEVEAALREHPGVADVVAFAAPDRLRGEQVCVAVVAHATCDDLTPAALQAFAAERLATFKAPRRIVMTDEIPLGPTGKVQRSRLAALLGLASADGAPGHEQGKDGTG